MSKTLSVKLDEKMFENLESTSRKTSLSKSALVKRGITLVLSEKNAFHPEVFSKAVEALINDKPIKNFVDWEKIEESIDKSSPEWETVEEAMSQVRMRK